MISAIGGDFVQVFARWIGVGYAIGVASGLDALRLSLVALGIKMDDEVILPTNTFIATALAVTAVGARPIRRIEGLFRRRVVCSIRFGDLRHWLPVAVSIPACRHRHVG